MKKIGGAYFKLKVLSTPKPPKLHLYGYTLAIIRNVVTSVQETRLQECCRRLVKISKITDNTTTYFVYVIKIDLI